MPKFTDEEQYLISVMRAEKGQSNSYMWGYLASGLLLSGFAAYYENIWMMLSALLVVCGFRIYEEWSQSKWNPMFRSIILKYEEAIREVGGDPTRS